MLKNSIEKARIFIIAIAVPIAVGVASALLTRGNMDIYSRINTPLLAPPAILFPIVWTALYTLMGISSAIVYLNRDGASECAYSGLCYYAASLFVNFFWSIIFFNLGAFVFAFVWLLLLLYLIIRTVISYFCVNKLAAYLQIPYLIWVGFAGYLTLAIWILNK